jgi:hypothetical protein
LLFHDARLIVGKWHRTEPSSPRSKSCYLILSTTELPQNRTARCRELLHSALALTDDLPSQAKLPAAAILGRKGGSVTAKRGSAYFRKLAARRKTYGGGRPRKESN